MADEKTTLDTGEPVYIIPPQPEAHVVSDEETINPGNPTAAGESISELIQQAVAELRAELMEELDTQVKEIQADLQADLQAELQKELKGGLELNAKG